MDFKNITDVVLGLVPFKTTFKYNNEYYSLIFNNIFTRILWHSNYILLIIIDLLYLVISIIIDTNAEKSSQILILTLLVIISTYLLDKAKYPLRKVLLNKEVVTIKKM